MFENLYALNALTKGSLSDTLGQRSWRLILAFMVRESNKVTIGDDEMSTMCC